ncbi:MAG: family 43 glycosylhydrolase [Nibricoccus sp.]
MLNRLVTSMLAFAGATLAIASETPAPVSFNWFEYSGRDTVFETPLPADHYRNPILAGYYPDPSICRIGTDYYLVNSSFSHFPGLPIFHSTDLVNWQQLGHVIDRPSQLKYTGLTVNQGLYAPTIRYHQGVYYVICTMIGSGGNFLVTATNPAGPWSDPIWLHFDGIDPSIFFDNDGRAWIVNNGNPPDDKPLYQGHRAIWIQEFDVAARKLIGPRSIIINGGVDLSKQPVWIEGPHLFKRKDWYYLCCAEGGTSVQHSQVIFRSKSPTGPFVPWEKNPILTQRDLDSSAPNAVTCTGHADMEIGPDGNWWAVFLACRPYAGKEWATGRETFLLPVTWTDDDWPVILPPGERVPYLVKVPATTNAQQPSAVAKGSTPLTGNFTWRDEFEGNKLSPLWIMLRAPRDSWWNISHGQLQLTPRPDRLEERSNPSFLSRRVQHAKFDAALSANVPREAGVTAGLAAFQSEKQYFRLGVSREEASMKIFVECMNAGKLQRLAEKILPATEKVELCLSANETKYTFFFTPEGEPTQTLLAETDSYPASVQAAGGGMHFTGLTIGPFAQLSSDNTTEHAAYPSWNNGPAAHQQLLEKARKGKIDLYFLGDSITRRWGALDYPEFLAHWKSCFHGWNAADFGWGGDSTHNILWRIQNGELDGVNPKVIVLLAGTNNIGKEPKPDAARDTIEGIEAILATCKAKAPKATIVLMAIFPRNDGPDSNKAIAEANRALEKFADGKQVRFLNINDQLADKEGKLFPGITVDNLHLSLKGYEIWAKNLTPILTKLLGPRASEDHAPPATGDIPKK